MLYLLEIYIKIDKFVFNYYDKALKLTKKKWDYEAAIYIKLKQKISRINIKADSCYGKIL